MFGVSRAAIVSSFAFGRQAYADIVAALNPLAYWHLGELAGPSIIDEKSVQNGTYQGTVEYGVEPIVNYSIGSAVGFTGSGSYGRIPHNIAFELAEGAIAFTVQPDTVSGQRMLVAKDAGGIVGGFTVDILDGQIRAYVRGTDGVAAWLPSPSGAGPVVADQAHHVVLTWGNRGSELWVDGELKASRPEITNGTMANAQDLFLGAYLGASGPTTFADAVLDEVALFSRQLRGDQLSSLAKAHSIDRSVVSEFITTPEAHGWSAGNSAAQNRAAFSAAITAASTNAASSGTGRGVVELTPGKVYTCIPAGNGVNANPDAAINLTAATPNVEIRTRDKPSIGGSQAILRFDTWSGYSGAHNRAILELRDVTNVVLGWLTLDGNKLSAGASYASRTSWLQNNVDYGHGGNGGIHNLSINGGSGIRLYQVESKDAIVDGLRLGSGVQAVTNFRAEDCDFHHCRRQGMTLVETQNTAATYDDLVFLRCKFREIGEQPDMRGEAPGCGLDVEPIGGNGILKVYGFTLDACDISDNHGYTMEKGVLFSQQLGRGLTYGGAPVLRYHRIVNSLFERNRVAGLVFNTANTAVIPQMRDFEIGNNVIRDNGQEGGSPNYMEFRSTVEAINLGTFFNFLIYNNEFTIGGSPNGGYNFQTRAADSGHSVSIYYGDFATNINTIANDQSTITTYLGFPS